MWLGKELRVTRGEDRGGGRWSAATGMSTIGRVLVFLATRNS